MIYNWIDNKTIASIINTIVSNTAFFSCVFSCLFIIVLFLITLQIYDCILVAQTKKHKISHLLTYVNKHNTLHFYNKNVHEYKNISHTQEI